MAGSNRTDWIACEFYSRPREVTAALLGSFVWTPQFTLLGVGFGFKSIDDPLSAVSTVHEFQDNETLTALRIVGGMRIEVGEGSSNAPIVFRERISVGIQDIQTLGTALPVGSDDDEAGEDAFLWERTQYLTPESVYPQSVDIPYWSQINIRVKRRLDRGMALLYSVAVLDPVPVISVTPYWRTLAKR